MAVTLSPIGGAATQFFDNNGVPLAGGKLYTYAAGTTTPQTTYTTSAGSVAQPNPIILDSAGRVPNSGEIWLTYNATYKFIIRTSADVLVGTYDNISGINSVTASQITYTPGGAGAVATTVQAKLRQTVSVMDFGAVGNGVTSDQTAIAAAVTYCAANNAILYWPTGNYVSSASVTSFHTVTHVGSGIVVRGSDNFHIENSNTITNNLYVSTTGSDANDGLSAAQPFATLQHAIDVLQNYVLTGSWVINLAAGDYSTVANRETTIGFDYWNPASASITPYTQNGVNSNNYLTIQGPDVGYDPATNPRPTPTAIFQGGGATAVGVTVRSANVIFKDIKFREYNGSTSSGGISAANSNIRTVNVHTYDCYIGVSGAHGNLEMQGGSIYGNATKTNTYGIRSIFQNKHAIGNQGAAGAGQGPLISFCTQGALIQEFSTGHFDSCSIEDCVTGLRVTVNSRVNYSYTNFKRNSVAIRADFNSNVFGSDTAVFNTNTADANTENLVLQNYASNANEGAYANSGTATDYLTSAYTLTGSTASTAILTKTLQQGFYSPVQSSIRKPQEIRFRAYGTISGTAGTKQFKLRLGTTILTSVVNVAADTGAWVCEGNITFMSPTLQTAFISYMCNSGTVKVNQDGGTESMNSGAKTLTFEIQPTSAADTIVVEAATFEVWG